MPERQRIIFIFIHHGINGSTETHFCRDSALQFRVFPRHSDCRLTGSIAIQLLVLILFVFNPGDLYYLGIINNNNNKHICIAPQGRNVRGAECLIHECVTDSV